MRKRFSLRFQVTDWRTKLDGAFCRHQPAFCSYSKNLCTGEFLKIPAFASLHGVFAMRKPGFTAMVNYRLTPYK